MDILETFFNLIGSLICHQLPSRSLSAGTMTLPVCARDMGIYAGIFTTALFLASCRRLKSQKPPGIVPAAIMCALMLPMVCDAILSYAGVIETNNTARLFTGLLFGLPIPFFLVPAAHFNVTGTNDRPVLIYIAELVPVYGAGIVLCLMLLKGIAHYFIAGSIFVLALLFLVSRICYTIFARVLGHRQKNIVVLTFAGTFFTLTLLYLLSAFVLQPLKQALLAG